MLLAILIASFTSYQSHNQFNEHLDELGNLIIEQAVSMSDLYFYTGNIPKLESVVDVMINIDGVVFVRFSDPQGNILSEIDNRTNDNYVSFYRVIRNTEVDINDFSFDASTHTETVLLGTILLGISKDIISKKQSQNLTLILLVTVISVTIGIVTSLLFIKKLTNAMSSLTKAAKEVERGNFDSRCIENGTGELLEFQTRFNHMLVSLHENELELQGKIDSATQSMKITLEELAYKNEQLEHNRQETLKLERSKAIADERSRIMRDMHDGIGGQLVESLALMELEPLTETNKNIRLILSECLDDFRLIINSLNIQANTLSALLADFKYRIQRKLDKMEINLKWQVIDNVDNVTIEPQQSLHILRILQEAFTNILKHAKATEINFIAVNTGNKIRIEITDNGRGSTLNQIPSGHGLSNMKWRANELSGELVIIRNQTGYRVILTIPT
jgi:signal transduction histidine kinase